MRTTILALCLTFSGAFIGLSQEKSTGILLLAHGGSATWNSMVSDIVEPLRSNYPTQVAFGMANPKTIEEGIRNLENEGVTEIVVVPLFISSHSFIIRQTEYFLGLRSELSDPLILMDHSNVGGSEMNHRKVDTKHEEKKPVQIKSSARIHLAKALDDHDIVSQILNKRISELSEKPTGETIIIVGHGPNPEEDNRNWIANMESLTQKIRMNASKSGVVYKNIFAVTVRDDAAKEIYEMAKENLRSLIRQSSMDSDVIVIPLLLSKGGIEDGIVKRMEGLNYKWSGNALLPDPLILDFILQSVTSVRNNSN